MVKSRMDGYTSFTIPALRGNEALITETLDSSVQAYWWDSEGVLSGLILEKDQAQFSSDMQKLANILHLLPLHIEFFSFDSSALETPPSPFPMTLGPFFVHSQKQKNQIPEGLIGLQLRHCDAFGAGDHATTASCIEAIAACCAHPVKKGLDVGCGTGILAIAMALLSKGAEIYACDNQESCVTIAHIHAFVNRLKNVHVVQSEGLNHPALKNAAPYDLIVANIHSNPLCAIASDIAAALAPDGRVILSGLLTTQEEQVMHRYREFNLQVIQTIRRGEWSTLLLKPVSSRPI